MLSMKKLSLNHSVNILCRFAWPIIDRKLAVLSIRQALAEYRREMNIKLADEEVIY